MGHRTFTSVPDFAFKDGDIIEIRASDRPADVLSRFPRRLVFVVGGRPSMPPMRPSSAIGTSIGYLMLMARPTVGSIPLGWSRAAIGLSAALLWSPGETGILAAKLRSVGPRSRGSIRRLVQHVGGLVHPAALAAGLRPYFLDRMPEAEAPSATASSGATASPRRFRSSGSSSSIAHSRAHRRSG